MSKYRLCKTGVVLGAPAASTGSWPTGRLAESLRFAGVSTFIGFRLAAGYFVKVVLQLNKRSTTTIVLQIGDFAHTGLPGAWC